MHKAADDVVGARPDRPTLPAGVGPETAIGLLPGQCMNDRPDIGCGSTHRTITSADASPSLAPGAAVKSTVRHRLRWPRTIPRRVPLPRGSRPRRPAAPVQGPGRPRPSARAARFEAPPQARAGARNCASPNAAPRRSAGIVLRRRRMPRAERHQRLDIGAQARRGSVSKRADWAATGGQSAQPQQSVSHRAGFSRASGSGKPQYKQC